MPSLPKGNLDFVDFSINSKCNPKYYLIEDKMTVKVQPIRIQQSVYLLIPKSIADLVDINRKTRLSLRVSKNDNSSVLEYHVREAAENYF